MLDWDRDQDEILAHHPIPIPPPPPPPAPPPQPRGWQGQWLIPITAGGTLVLGLNMFWASEPPQPAMPVSIAAFGQMPLPEARPPAPAIALQVYDEDQAVRFARGLARFDTPSLWAYAAQTRADMALRNQPLGAELADALALIEAEIARRGRGAGGG